jgi:hypothetical protein
MHPVVECPFVHGEAEGLVGRCLEWSWHGGILLAWAHFQQTSTSLHRWQHRKGATLSPAGPVPTFPLVSPGARGETRCARSSPPRSRLGRCLRRSRRVDLTSYCVLKCRCFALAIIDGPLHRVPFTPFLAICKCAGTFAYEIRLVFRRSCFGTGRDRLRNSSPDRRPCHRIRSAKIGVEVSSHREV